MFGYNRNISQYTSQQLIKVVFILNSFHLEDPPAVVKWRYQSESKSPPILRHSRTIAKRYKCVSVSRSSEAVLMFECVEESQWVYPMNALQVALKVHGSNPGRGEIQAMHSALLELGWDCVIVVSECPALSCAVRRWVWRWRPSCA